MAVAKANYNFFCHYFQSINGESKTHSIAYKLIGLVCIKGRFIIYEDDRVGKKIIAFLFLSKARPKGILFFRSPFSIWGQIFQSPFKLK